MGVCGWGLVKVPGRWYVAVTMPVMSSFWCILLFSALGSLSHSVELRMRDANGILFAFEFGLGPIIATFLGVMGLVRKRDTVRRAFLINQWLAWPYAFVTYGFWGLLFYAARRGV